MTIATHVLADDVPARIREGDGTLSKLEGSRYGEEEFTRQTIDDVGVERVARNPTDVHAGLKPDCPLEKSEVGCSHWVGGVLLSIPIIREH